MQLILIQFLLIIFFERTLAEIEKNPEHLLIKVCLEESLSMLLNSTPPKIIQDNEGLSEMVRFPLLSKSEIQAEVITLEKFPPIKPYDPLILSTVFSEIEGMGGNIYLGGTRVVPHHFSITSDGAPYMVVPITTTMQSKFVHELDHFYLWKKIRDYKLEKYKKPSKSARKHAAIEAFYVMSHPENRYTVEHRAVVAELEEIKKHLFKSDQVEIGEKIVKMVNLKIGASVIEISRNAVYPYYAAIYRAVNQRKSIIIWKKRLNDKIKKLNSSIFSKIPGTKYFVNKKIDEIDKLLTSIEIEVNNLNRLIEEYANQYFVRLVIIANKIKNEAVKENLKGDKYNIDYLLENIEIHGIGKHQQEIKNSIDSIISFELKKFLLKKYNINHLHDLPQI